MSECPIPCNLCGSVDVDELGTRDRDGRPLRTTICRRCGLVWSNPRPAEAEVRRYYSREYRLDYKGQATPSLRHTARSARGALNRSRSLAPFLKPGDRILDVGAGSGEVVYVLQRKGFNASGLEPDEEYARYAREQLGVAVITGFVQDVAFPEGSFHVITMYHALEHVEDPSRILETLRTWLTEDGLLLVEVPNVEAVCLSPAHRFHFAHFYNFNRETLEALGRKAGFSSVQTTTSPDEGNLVSLFRRVPAARPVSSVEGNYARVFRRVRSHTAAAYYLSPAPYAGVLGRLRAYLTDTSAARRATTAKDVLERLLRREDAMTAEYAIPVEYASDRKIRIRNKLHYRFNHWPIWIFVFFIAPGPLTFDLFERGFDARMAAWLGAVLVGTGIAGIRGRLPGVEPAPYIIRFTEDRPNPLYRRVCYTFAWSAAITFAVLNIAGLVVAIVTGGWYLKQIYRYAYFPIAGSIWLLGLFGRLPRVMASTKGEGHERRYFYGTVWAMCIAQPALWLMWYVLPKTRVGDSIKLIIFLGILAYVGNLARLGRLPRTRPIVPGELAVSD